MPFDSDTESGIFDILMDLVPCDNTVVSFPSSQQAPSVDRVQSIVEEHENNPVVNKQRCDYYESYYQGPSQPNRWNKTGPVYILHIKYIPKYGL